MSVRLRTAIQTKVQEMVESAKFYRVKYDPDTRRPDAITTADVRPGTYLVNEVGSTWEPDPRNGSSVATKRSRWVFELLLEFPVEVTLEEFEALFLSVAVLPAATDAGYAMPGALLYITAAEIQHPTIFNPISGTKAKYKISAHPLRGSSFSC